MARCSVCRTYGCNKGQHIQKCVICGQDERVIDERAEVDKGYKCADSKRHEVIRGGFGNERLIRESRVDSA